MVSVQLEASLMTVIRTKNNPILLGQAGVGKTAIAKGLASRVSDANVPVFLLTKRVMGELEGRVTSLIREVKESGNVILFIDEVHTLIGSGTVGRGNQGSGLQQLMIKMGAREIAEVASLWSAIPIQQLTVYERMLLVGLDERLKERVCGQDEAVDASVC
ncbi:putative AAA+ ATPase domain, ATPase, AAA-type, core [Helianthus annuus]|nr:putative AAA+ ATPase domain, ATPase, AAA-type, core [Helianthus annuus]